MAKATADIRSLARGHTETAIRVLAGIMAEKKAPHSARVAAAQALLDRGWGKPKETVDLTVNHLEGMLSEINGKTRGLPRDDTAEHPTIQ
jgi:hypothetical protein